MSLVQTENLWRRFGRHEALRGLTLSVPEGGVYALIGANGAGKTTALRVLVNLLEPTRGAASVLGTDSRRLSPGILAQIGYVSENQALPARLRVGEYFDYLRRLYRRWDPALEGSLRERLQLPQRQRIGALSHGVRIKVALAAALAYRPRLLILDEPFAGLDMLVREEFMEGLLQQAGDLTILITSHELPEIESVTTHVGFIHLGRMLFEEPMSELGARMREVRITLAQPASMGAPWPREWLDVRAFGNLLTFVDTRYSEEHLGERIRSLVGPARQIDVAPMSLRSVFTTIARAARDGALP